MRIADVLFGVLLVPAARLQKFGDAALKAARGGGAAPVLQPAPGVRTAPAPR